MPPFPFRVLVADGQRIAREVLVARLERADLNVVGAASDAAQAIEVAGRMRPDVALLDVQLPGGAVYATKAIISGVNGCRVLALTGDAESGDILQLLLAGAEGYVVKGTSDDELLAAVRRPAHIQTGLSVEVVTSLMGNLLGEITDMSEMHERLRRSEEKFRSLLEAAPDAVVIVDGEGEIVFVNRQTESMFGYAQSELLGSPVEVLVPERFHVDHIRHRIEYLVEPRIRRMGSVPHLAGRRRDATEFPVDISLSAVDTDEGTFIIAFVRELLHHDREDLELWSHQRPLLVDDAHGELIDLAGVEDATRTRRD